MRRVVAVTETERPSVVSAVAEAVAGILGATVSRLAAPTQADWQTAAVLDRIGWPDTVLARDWPRSDRAWWIATETTKPVIVVPPTLGPADARSITRMLVPLDGTMRRPRSR